MATGRRVTECQETPSLSKSVVSTLRCCLVQMFWKWPNAMVYYNLSFISVLPLGEIFYFNFRLILENNVIKIFIIFKHLTVNFKRFSLLVSLIIWQYLVPFNAHPNFCGALCAVDLSTLKPKCSNILSRNFFAVRSLFCSGSFPFLLPPCFAFTWPCSCTIIYPKITYWFCRAHNPVFIHQEFPNLHKW